MALVKKLSARLQNHPKRVIYPEGSDPRIIQAARQFATRKLGVPILVGQKSKIEEVAKQYDVRLEGLKIIDPQTADDTPMLAKLMKGLAKFKKYDDDQIQTMIHNPNYFATLMVATGRADAIVAGATTATSSALRPIFQIIPLQKGFSTASSMMIVSTENPSLGINGDLFLADCGVIPEPTEEQLCDIAITTAILTSHLTLEIPRVAMLSYSSKSVSSKMHSVLKIKSATFLAHEKAKKCDVEIDIDGELQIDAALNKDVAELKNIKSSVAGRANILVFPDLNSGNIASKMIQTISSASCYGQILTGLSKPVAEISRGASVNEIFGTSVIVGGQAVDRKFISTESI